jgi:hypothetical protein
VSPYPTVTSSDPAVSAPQCYHSPFEAVRLANPFDEEKVNCKRKLYVVAALLVVPRGVLALLRALFDPSAVATESGGLKQKGRHETTHALR